MEPSTSRSVTSADLGIIVMFAEEFKGSSFQRDLLMAVVKQINRDREDKGNLRMNLAEQVELLEVLTDTSKAEDYLKKVQPTH